MARDEGIAKVTDALDEHTVRLLRNWARWFSGSSDAYARTSAYDDCQGGGWGDGGVPILSGEAQDVDAALHAIDQRYRRAVMMFWLHEGESLQRLAVRIRPTMDYRTAQVWIIRGHELLRAELNRRRSENASVRMRNEQAATGA